MNLSPRTKMLKALYRAADSGSKCLRDGSQQARSLEEVRQKDLRAGDRVLVTTRNSFTKFGCWMGVSGLRRLVRSASDNGH